MGAGEKKYQEKCLLERVRALYFDRVYNKTYLINACKFTRLEVDVNSVKKMYWEGQSKKK